MDNVYAPKQSNIASANGKKAGGKYRDIIAEQMVPLQIDKPQELAGQSIKKEDKDSQAPKKLKFSYRRLLDDS